MKKAYPLLCSALMWFASNTNAAPTEHFYFNFDAGVMPEQMVKPNDADSAWLITDVFSRSGQYSIRADNATQDSVSKVNLLVNSGVKSKLVWSVRKLADNGDQFRLYINNSGHYYRSGDWRMNVTYLEAGENTITFEVINSDPNSNVYIDDIALFTYENNVDQDQDNDNMPDVWEYQHQLDFNTANGSDDEDNDGLSNQDEYTHYVDPNNGDTDGDGLTDGDEVHIHGTLPSYQDSDFDKMPDGWEVQYGLEPTINDRNDDLDGDSVNNLDEYYAGTDPTDNNSFPQLITLEQINFNDYKMPTQWRQADDDGGYWRMQKGKGINGGVAIAPSNYNAEPIFLERNSYFADGIFYIVAQGKGGDNKDYLWFWNRTAGVGIGSGLINRGWQTYGYKIEKGMQNIEISWERDENSIARNQEFWIDNITFIANDSDNDNDGILDQYEMVNGLDFFDPNDAHLDLDNDGLSNIEEFNYNTKADDPDSDNDGLTDGEEINQYLTNPLMRDTDQDLMSDGWEVTYGFDPTTFNEEKDSDGDYFSDYQEHDGDTNPLDPQSYPEGVAVMFESFEQTELPSGFYNDSNYRVPWQSGITTDASAGEASLSSTLSAQYYRSSVIHWIDNFSKGGFSFDYKLTGGKIDVYIGFEHITTLDSASEQWQTFHHRVPSGEHWISFYYHPKDSDTQSTTAFIDNLNYLPNAYDSDGDGMPDIWELDHQLDRSDPTDAALDIDGDGLTNVEEYLHGANPRSIDSDGDGMPDSYEVAHQLDPGNTDDAFADADSDGIDNITEFNLGLNPQDSSDAHSDLDNDGFSNLQEILGGSDPLDPNSIPSTIGNWIFMLLNDDNNPTTTGAKQ